MKIEERYRLIEKIIKLLEEGDELEETCIAYQPSYEKVKRLLLEKKDEISDEILLLGELLIRALMSAIYSAKTADDLTIEYSDGELKIKCLTNDIKKGTGDMDKVEVTTFSTKQKYPAHKADVHVTKKYLFIHEDDMEDKTWDEIIYCTSVWYNSKTGLPVAIGYCDAIKQKETKDLMEIKKEFLRDDCYTELFHEINKELSYHIPIGGLMMKKGTRGNGALLHTKCPLILKRETDTTVSLIRYDQQTPIIEFQKPLTELQKMEMERVLKEEEEKYLEGKQTVNRNLLEAYYGYNADRMGLVDSRIKELGIGGSRQFS